MADRLGGIDLLINSAGVLKGQAFESAADSAITEEVAVNLLGSVRMTRVAMPFLRRSDDGAVVLFSSAVALGASPGLAVYAASQSSVLRVRALEVVDASGRSRIHLSTLRGWPEITILDTAGHGRIGLSMDPGESTAVLSLAGRDPRSRLVLMPARLTVGDTAGDQVSLTIQGLKRFVLGGRKNCPDNTIWSVP